jgi:hypothetical protein
MNYDLFINQLILLKMQTDSENAKRDTLKIESAIKSMLPDKLANGLTREDACILYMGKNKVQETDEGLVILDRKLNLVPVADHIKTFVESFGTIKTERKFTKRSELESYFEENNTPLSEQSGILAKAMKNEGFKINE